MSNATNVCASYLFEDIVNTLGVSVSSVANAVGYVNTWRFDIRDPGTILVLAAIRSGATISFGPPSSLTLNGVTIPIPTFTLLELHKLKQIELVGNDWVSSSGYFNDQRRMIRQQADPLPPLPKPVNDYVYLTLAGLAFLLFLAFISEVVVPHGILRELFEW